jgi:hypothetical protein
LHSKASASRFKTSASHSKTSAPTFRNARTPHLGAAPSSGSPASRRSHANPAAATAGGAHAGVGGAFENRDAEVVERKPAPFWGGLDVPDTGADVRQCGVAVRECSVAVRKCIIGLRKSTAGMPQPRGHLGVVEGLGPKEPNSSGTVSSWSRHVPTELSYD